MTSAPGATISGSATTIDTEDLTANRAVISNGSQKIAVSATTSTELGYVNGVTSAIQTQLDAKQPTITGSATTIDTESLTASRAVISNGSQKIAVSATTSTELGYVNGVTSAIQTQIDTKEQIGKKTMWIPAAAMYANTTAGCSALTQVELANGPELKVLDFAAAADDHAQFTISMPKSWNEGTVTFQPYWTVTGTNTGTVVWGMSAVACADNATQNVTFGSIAVTAAKAHSGTSNDINVSAESAALTIKNAAVDTLTYFQIFNDTSASGQTGVVRLTGIKLLYTTDAVNDA